MRELKFRLRLKELTKQGYREWFEYYTIGEIIAGGAITTASIIAIDEYIGLRDKNGKKIYEEDIVQCKISSIQRFRGTIEYGEGHFFIQAFWYSFKPSGRWDLQKAPLSGKSNTKLSIQNEIEKVIGNIYENPELLK